MSILYCSKKHVGINETITTTFSQGIVKYLVFVEGIGYHDMAIELFRLKLYFKSYFLCNKPKGVSIHIHIHGLKNKTGETWPQGSKYSTVY